MSGSDHLDSSSYDHVPDDGGVAISEREVGDGDGASETSLPKGSTKGKKKVKRRKEKKRPRDKLLRDPQVGRTVLELRKKGEVFEQNHGTFC